MKTTKDSRKGGAVAYGLHLATTKRTPPSPEVQEHLCGITDGDLSLNLALTGSLAQALLGEKRPLPRGTGREREPYDPDERIPKNRTMFLSPTDLL